MKRKDIEELKVNDPYQGELAARLAGKFRHMAQVPVMTLGKNEFNGIACLSMEAKTDESGNIGYAEDLAKEGEFRYAIKISREHVDKYGPKLLDSLLRHEYFHSTSLPVTPRGLMVEYAIIKALGEESGKSWLKEVDLQSTSNILEDMFADWNVREKGNEAYVEFLRDMVGPPDQVSNIGYPMILLYYVRLHQNAGPDDALTKAVRKAIAECHPEFPLRTYTDILDSTRRWHSNADFLRAYCRLCRLLMKHWPHPSKQNQGNGPGQGGKGGQQGQGAGQSVPGGGGDASPGTGSGLNDPAAGASGSCMGITEEDIAAAIKDMKDGLAGSVLGSEGVTPDAGSLAGAIIDAMGQKGACLNGSGVGIGTGMKLLIETLNDPDLLAILFPPVEGENDFGRTLPLRVPPRETFKWGSDRIRDMDVPSTVKRFGGGHTATLMNMRKRNVLELPIPVIQSRTNTPPIFALIDTSGSMNPVEIARAIMILKKTAEELNTGFGLVLFHSSPYFSDYWPQAKDFEALSVVAKIQTGGTNLSTALLKTVDKCANVLCSSVNVDKQTGYLVIMSDFELVDSDRAAYAKLCLTNPTLSMMRQLHISISKAPVSLPPPHVGIRAKSFKDGAKEARDILNQCRYEPSVGLNRY